MHQTWMKRYINHDRGGGSGQHCYAWTDSHGEGIYVSSDSTGGGRPHHHEAESLMAPHMPPYYALCFIIKVI